MTQAGSAEPHPPAALAAVPVAAVPVAAVPVAAAALRERCIDGSYTPAQWLSFLPGLAERDRREDKQRGTLLAVTIGFGMVGLAAGIFLAMSGLAFVLVVWAVVEVGLIVATVRMNRRDLSNQLREAVVPLLGVLREEMDPAEPLRLKLDLRGRLFKTKLSRTDKPAKTRHFVDPWMSASGKLADGALLSFQVVDHASLRSVTKRAGSGKYKTKIKACLSTLIDVNLRVRVKDYVSVPPVPDRPGLKNPEQAKFLVKEAGKRISVRVRRVIKSRGAEGLLDVNEFLGTVALAYKSVVPRPEAK